MNTLFRPYLWRFIIVFFDDILIYSGSVEEHLTHLEVSFQVFLDHQFVLKLSKCFFAQSQVEYLGHLVSHEGVQLVASKVEAIHQWPVPQSTKVVYNFLGLARFYQQFIKSYATIVAPLVKITMLERFQWLNQAQAAFEHLKRALSEAPVLALPNFQLPFTVEIDTSGVGMGTVLSQQGHPIAFFNKSFTPRFLGASTYVQELFAITATVKKWCQYLLGHRFTIITDYWSLKELLTQVIQTPEQQTYLAWLMGYDYQIIYRSRTHNQAADALSQLPKQESSSLMTLYVLCLTFIDEHRKQLENYPAYVDRRHAIM